MIRREVPAGPSAVTGPRGSTLLGSPARTGWRRPGLPRRRRLRPWRDTAGRVSRSAARTHAGVFVSFTDTSTWRYELGAAAGSCRTTSLNIQLDTMSARTPGDSSRADLSV